MFLPLAGNKFDCVFASVSLLVGAWRPLCGFSWDVDRKWVGVMFLPLAGNKFDWVLASVALLVGAWRPLCGFSWDVDRKTGTK